MTAGDLARQQDRAFADAIMELSKGRQCGHVSLQEAIINARNGFRSTAWNYALSAGIPHDELAAIRALIYE